MAPRSPTGIANGVTIGSLVRAANTVFLFLLAGSVAAQAAEIRMLVSPGFGPVMQDLGPKFERATGHKLAVSSDSLGAIVKRVRDGESCDIVLSPRSAIDGFVIDGRAAPGSVTLIASAGMGVAVRAGAPKPDVSSPEALKHTLLAARSITYPDPKNAAGNPALGIHLARVFDHLGITNELKSKTVFSSSLAVGELVASGEAEVGIAQLQNLNRSAGIEIVGPLPGDLQDPVVFAAAILAGARDIEAAKALVNFLRTPEAAAAMRAQRMDPVRP
jgi:molybdate transport system substrate-binding protein